MSNLRILPIPLGGGGVTPTGTLEIRSEGVFDVTNYAEVDVDIFDDTTTKNITANGIYNAEDDQVLGYSQVTVAVPASAVDTGTKQTVLTENGVVTENVVGYANNEITVNVPASAVDTGTKSDTITTNGTSTIDVVGYANHEVIVNVPASAVDVGTLTIEPITQNVTLFTQDVTGYRAIAFQVSVPASEVDTGTKQDTITTNGTSTITVVGYANHEVTVAVPASAVDYGTKQITQNGANQDVVGYAAVDVNVQPNLQAKSNIDPTTSSQTVIADQNYDGLSSVQINAVTASVDANITAGNIKNGVSILGVTGSYTGEGIIPTGTLQITRNGIHDVTQYASVDVNVASSDLDYFYIEAVESTNVGFNPRSGYTLYYSTDNKTTWNTITSNTTVSLSQGDKMYCYGTCAPSYYEGSGEYSYFTISTGNVALGGHICTLYYPSISYSCPQYCFYKLFQSCGGVKDISNLVLPSDIGKQSFAHTFRGTGITNFTENYITNVSEASFNGSFFGCTSLTTVNAFNNIIEGGKNNSYKTNCFYQTFYGCTSLVNVNAFNSNDTYISSSQYSYTFYGCSALVDASNIFKNNVIETTNNSSFSSCFRDCSSLEITPNFENIKSFGYYSFDYMFMNCTSLVTGAKFGTSDKNTYGANAFNSTYNGCTSLTYVYFPNFNSWNSGNTSNWLQNVAATGYVFVNNSDLTIDSNSASGIPSGWTRIDVTATGDYVNNTLSLSSSAGTIYYSTNETDPLSSFTQYTTPISVPQAEIDDFPARAYVVINGVQSYVSSVGLYTPFYIETINGGTTVTYSHSNYLVSTDMSTWNTASGTYTLSNAGDRLYLKRTGGNGYPNIKPTFAGADFKVGGKVVSLFSAGSLAKGFKPTQYGSTLNQMFYNNTYLTDISNLIYDLDLSTAQSKDMFRTTFYGCTNLTNGKMKYNSSYIGEACFYDAFYNTKITETPDFRQITTVDNNGFLYAFRVAGYLNTVYAPNVTTWNRNNYNAWLSGVASSGTFYAPAGVTIPTNDYSGIPSGWTRVDY